MVIIPSELSVFPLPNKYPCPSITLTSHVADFVPFAFFAVIVAVPAAFAVTSPVSFTIATSVSLLVHCIFSVASAGATVAVICDVVVLIKSKIIIFLSNVISCINVSTITSQVAVNPFSVLTVI